MNEPELILVVDDKPANLVVMSETLTDAGYDVATAIDGERALKQVDYHPPDLILLDIMMPGIDGFETCRQLKDNTRIQDIPVIFMTANADVESKVKGFELGAVDYITKPFQEKEVLVRIKNHLKLRSLTKDLEKQVMIRTTQLSQTIQKLQESQVQLIQREKMSALGQLVAGVAHEINNPISFIAGNLKPLDDYFQELISHLALYQSKFPEPGEEILNHADQIDLEYMFSDLPKILISMVEGTERIIHISNSLRNFSRTDCDRKIVCNIHESIDSTILILKHRLKANDDRPAIEVEKQYNDLPEISCFPGQLSQVFMNLLANAIDALEESNQGKSFHEIANNPNQISIRTALADNQQSVVIEIEDNGLGMPEAVQQKIFEHSFTTKPVGQGTGLGLAIVHQIVVEKHDGSVRCTSSPGNGTQFTVELPL
ncbi:MAG: sensor histidine kinase [Thainema sp.]